MLSLKRQLQTTSGLSETSGPTSSLLSIANQPLSSYSLYGTTTTSTSLTNFIHTYPSTLSYHGNSSYTSSYTSQQPSYGGLLLGKSQPTSYSPNTSSYGYTLTTTSELNFGYKYQTSTITTSPLLTNTSTKLVTMDTVEKSRDQVTIDTEKDRNKQDDVQSTEATLVLPELVDNTTQLTSQVQPTATSHG